MTANRVFVAMEKYKKLVPKDKLYTLEGHFRFAPNECMDDIMFCIKTKSIVAAVLFSIFFGGLAVNRFYIGDRGVAALKLSLWGLSCLFSWVPVLGILISLASFVFNVVDIFLTYRIAKQRNYDNILFFLRRKERESIESSVH